MVPVSTSEHRAERRHRDQHESGGQAGRDDADADHDQQRKAGPLHQTIIRWHRTENIEHRLRDDQDAP